MSLIICSNNRSENEDVGDRSSIFEPWSFRNQLTSNIEIPKDAQVALQSVKINMDGSIVVGDDTKIFYSYFGFTLHEPDIYGIGQAATRITNIMDSGYVPLRISLFPGSSPNLKKVNVNDIARELQRSVRENITNPNLKTRFIAKAVLNANGSLKGFKFEYNESITGFSAGFAPTDGIPPVFNPAFVAQRGVMDCFMQKYRTYQITGGAQGQAPPWTYVINGQGEGQFDVAGIRQEPACVIANVSPINLKGGKCAFRISGAAAGPNAGRFMVGLTRGSRQGSKSPRIRPLNTLFGNGAMTKPWMGAFMDYFVYMNAPASPAGFGSIGARGYLRIGHSVVNKNDLGGHAGPKPGAINMLKQQDFRYGNGTGGSADTGTAAAVVASAGWDPVYGYNYTTNALDIEYVLFDVQGGIVSVSLESSQASGSNIYSLVTYSNARDMERNLKPITQPCENLLPSMVLSNKSLPVGAANLRLDIQMFEGNKASCPNYDFLSDEKAKNGLADRAYASDKQTMGQIQRLDSVRCVDYSAINLGKLSQLHQYPTYLSAGDNSFIHLDHVWSVMPNVEYGGPDCMLTAGANTSRFLGFPDIPNFTTWTLATGEREAESFSIPNLLPSRSVFVRLENFGNESVNAFQGLRSKIIAHLPRFDGINSLGPLYLEPNNLVYVDLKNPNAMKINSFDISLCYSDETYADSLVGTTIVVLHIKQKGS